MEDQGPISENIIYKLTEAEKCVRDRLIATFKKEGHDITPEQFTILVALWYLDGINQNIIAATVKRDKTTISRVLDRMVKNGLIVRGKGIDDRRERNIYITKKGKNVQEQLMDRANAVYSKALKGVPMDEIALAGSVLDRIMSNMSEEGND